MDGSFLAFQQDDYSFVERLNSLLQIIFRDLFFCHVSLFSNVINDFVFEKRRAQLLLHLRVFANIVKERTFLTRILTAWFMIACVISASVTSTSAF